MQITGYDTQECHALCDTLTLPISAVPYPNVCLCDVGCSQFVRAPPVSVSVLAPWAASCPRRPGFGMACSCLGLCPVSDSACSVCLQRLASVWFVSHGGSCSAASLA